MPQIDLGAVEVTVFETAPDPVQDAAQDMQEEEPDASR
jgi:hypothetical protein